MNIGVEFLRLPINRGDIMNKIRKGDIVKRKIFDSNILFTVKETIGTNEAIIKGVTLRIEEIVNINELEKKNVVEATSK